MTVSKTTNGLKIHRLSNESGVDLLVVFDRPDRAVNVIDRDVMRGIESVVTEIEREPAAFRSLVFMSAKSHCFLAGADVEAIAQIPDTTQALTLIAAGQNLFNRIAALSVPSVAIVEGSCLGGGLELALACDYRVAVDKPSTKFALPEVKLGLIPGWGGTQRLPQTVPLPDALKMILTGKALSAKGALANGLVDRQLDAMSGVDEVPQLVARLIAEGKRSRTWSQWLLASWIGRRWVLSRAGQKIREKVQQFPALPAALDAVEAGLRSKGRAFDVEAARFQSVLFSPTARNLLDLFQWRNLARRNEQEVTHGKDKQPNSHPQTIAVVGAGVMGAGIAALACKKGIRVIVKEIHAQAADAGYRRIQQILSQHVDSGRLTKHEKRAAEDRLQITTAWSDLADCDLAIEAVSEIEAVKREVFEMLDRSLHPDGIIVSNTSSLTVTGLMNGARRHRVAGLHFFNPVHRMELVELVRTEFTSQETMQKLLELVRQLGKTPVQTSDKPGFLVNRVLFPYLGEAVRMVSEGYDILQLDAQMKRFGMPMGPLTLLDHVGIDIASHVARSLASVHHDAETPAGLLSRMVDHGWLGEKALRGFYEYAGANKGSCNEELETERAVPILGAGFRADGLTAAQRRMIYPLLNEAVHCLDEAVVSEPWMVDLSMVLGTGFAPHMGGPLRMIDMLGPETVLENMRILAEIYGCRFEPADGMVRCVRNYRRFHRDQGGITSTWESTDEPRYSKL